MFLPTPPTWPLPQPTTPEEEPFLGRQNLPPEDLTSLDEHPNQTHAGRKGPNAAKLLSMAVREH